MAKIIALSTGYNRPSHKAAHLVQDNGVAMIFFWGATRFIFVTSPGAHRIQWGGGSSRNFSWSQLPDRIQWGGGGG